MNIKINVEKRETNKKSDLNELRKKGFIPAVIYGKDFSEKITLVENDFNKEYKKSIGHLAFFDFVFNKKEYKTIIKEKQIHPVTRKIIHVDFLELKTGKEITVNIPIHFEGIAPGTKTGGVLDISMRSLEITCLPKDMPEEIVLDISKLELGNAIHVKDLSLSDKILVHASKDQSVVSVNIPHVSKDTGKEAEAETEEKAKKETEKAAK